MVDRHDIDALLIGSLYGELSSADEARLRAHLESHPADRTALDGLTRARDAVRASRIFEVQLEPSQAVSALLLQEAARRAPRKARTEQEREGWFVRLRRSFLMHPAMAAAAMLVVVVGVAGTLYMRQGDHFAAPMVSSGGRAAEPPPAAPGTAMAPEAAVASGSGGAAPAQTAAALGPAAKDASAKRDQDSYRVGIVDGNADRRPERQAKKPADNVASADPVPATPAPPPAPEPAKAEQAEKTKLAQARPGMLEVATPRRVTKELEEGAAGARRAVKGRAPASVPVNDADDAEDAKLATAPAADPSSTVKRGNAPAMPPPEAAPPAPAPASIAQDVSKTPADPTGGSFAVAPGGAGARDPNLAWARDQHSRLVIQVRAGRCSDAATTALALSNRTPGYYQQNVATDRSVKDCLAYINAERERAADQSQRARATSRRLSDEATVPARKESPAATKRATPPPRNAPAKPAGKSAPAPSQKK